MSFNAGKSASFKPPTREHVRRPPSVVIPSPATTSKSVSWGVSKSPKAQTSSGALQPSGVREHIVKEGKMPNKNFNQKTPEPRPSPGLQRNKGHTPTPDNTPDGTANWPTHGGVAGPMGIPPNFVYYGKP